MNNHIHIILYDPDFTMNRLFQKTHSMYARYFNYKYERSGNLFQGRYKSKGIIDEKQLCATIRYVLKNPEDAGICNAIDYPWSSYKLYGKRNYFVNSKKIEEYLGDFSSFQKFIESKNNEIVFRPNDVDDEILKNLIYRNFGYRLSTFVRGLPRRTRDEVILFLYSKGASIKQIVRLTGVSYGIIYRLSSKDKKILTSK